MAFLLIGWEVKGYFKSLRIVGILIPIYFAVFFVDLVQFSTSGDETEAFTHAKIIELKNQFGHISRKLELIYVFHHWSRLFATCIRNVLCLVSIQNTSQDKLTRVTILKS